VPRPPCDNASPRRPLTGSACRCIAVQLTKVPRETVEEIWKVRHDDDSERIGAVLTKQQFEELRSRARSQCEQQPGPPHPIPPQHWQCCLT
jgi:hypothetical protein